MQLGSVRLPHQAANDNSIARLGAQRGRQAGPVVLRSTHQVSEEEGLGLWARLLVLLQGGGGETGPTHPLFRTHPSIGRGGGTGEVNQDTPPAPNTRPSQGPHSGEKPTWLHNWPKSSFQKKCTKPPSLPPLPKNNPPPPWHTPTGGFGTMPPGGGGSILKEAPAHSEPPLPVRISAAHALGVGYTEYHSEQPSRSKRTRV